VFPQLDSMSIAELEDLVNDPDALAEFVENLEQVQPMVTLRNEMDTAIQELSRTNMEKIAQLEQLQQRAATLRVQLEHDQTELKEKTLRQQRVMEVSCP